MQQHSPAEQRRFASCARLCDAAAIRAHAYRRYQQVELHVRVALCRQRGDSHQHRCRTRQTNSNSPHHRLHLPYSRLHSDLRMVVDCAVRAFALESQRKRKTAAEARRTLPLRCWLCIRTNNTHTDRTTQTSLIRTQDTQVAEASNTSSSNNSNHLVFEWKRMTARERERERGRQTSWQADRQSGWLAGWLAVRSSPLSFACVAVRQEEWIA